jgi:hypothetical protein
MSFNYSPKIVTNGLVFYTDPFNFNTPTLLILNLEIEV